MVEFKRLRWRIKWLSLKLSFYHALFTFGAYKVRVRLKSGVFSDSNISKICSQANPKVRVRLKLGCGLN